MRIVRILAIATAIEICFASFALALLGLAGAANAWLDLVNCIAPLLAVGGLAGAAAARAALPQGPFRLTCMGLALAGSCYAGMMMAPEFEGQSPGGTAAGWRYRVVSANVFRDNLSPLHAASTVTALDVDAVLLQEADNLNATPRSRIQLDRLYPYASQCAGDDVQIRVRTPILDEGCGLDVADDLQGALGAAFVWVRVLGPDRRPLVLATVHLERPYPPGLQALARRALARAIERLPRGEPLILAGDFNTVPWSFGMRTQDGLLKPLRRRTRFQPTFPAQINVTSQPWDFPMLPIDHLYASPNWQLGRLSRFRVPGSDHFALMAELILRR
jgi:vancomycin resistance protein VanJ